MFLHCENTVELRRNELRRDWKNQKMCSLIRFHTFYYYWAQNYRLLHRDLHQIGVRYIRRGCTVIDYAVPYSYLISRVLNFAICVILKKIAKLNTREI